MRSHPPTLITLARRAMTEIALPAGSRVLVAVSGGPDSMALLDVLAKLRIEIVAHGVDHGLRAGAAAELDIAEAHAAKLGVAFGRTRVSVGDGSNVQERARTARHAALEAARKRAKATTIATAHHADDRAETLLIRLLRGAGPGGLAILPPRDGKLVRPFIRARRADILAHLERHHVAFARDPSNESTRFLRTRIRQEVLPLLEELDPAVVTHLCALADDLASERDEHAPYRIPRAARLALGRLARSVSPKMNVLLPGGIEARRTKKR